MMNSNIGSTQESREAARQGDGRLSVTLLGLLGLLAAFAAFDLTGRFLVPQDNLYVRLPADDVALYTHVNAATLPAGPYDVLRQKDIKADEIARFAVAANENELVWGTLLGWRGRPRLTADENAALAAAQAVKLDERTYFIGDPRLAEYLTAEDPRIAALGADIAVGRALTTVRGLAPVQGYVDPLLLARVRGLAGSELLAGTEPLVFSLNLEPASIRMIALPVLTAARYPSWLGFAPTRVSARALSAPPSASLLLSLDADRSIFDPLTAMFRKIETARQRLPLDRTEKLGDSETALRKMLDRPAILSLFSRDDGSGADFLASYPGLAVSDLVSALTEYVSAALPERTTFILPDEDNAVELRYNLDKYAPVNQDGIEMLEIPDLELSLFLTADGSNGSYIASNKELLAEYSRNKGLKGKEGVCNSINGPRISVSKPILTSLIQLLGQVVELPPLETNKLNSALFIDNDDGIIIGCGYLQ